MMLVLFSYSFQDYGLWREVGETCEEESIIDWATSTIAVSVSHQMMCAKYLKIHVALYSTLSIKFKLLLNGFASRLVPLYSPAQIHQP